MCVFCYGTYAERGERKKGKWEYISEKQKLGFLKRERYVIWPSRKLKDVVKYDLMILKREWRKSSDNC